MLNKSTRSNKSASCIEEIVIQCQRPQQFNWEGATQSQHCMFGPHSSPPIAFVLRSLNITIMPSYLLQKRRTHRPHPCAAQDQLKTLTWVSNISFRHPPASNSSTRSPAFFPSSFQTFTTLPGAYTPLKTPLPG